MASKKDCTQIIKPTILGLGVFYLLLIFSCKRNPEVNCQLSSKLKEPVEIRFKDTTATQFVLSPLEANKVWVKKIADGLEIWEIDVLTKEQKMLEKKFWHFFIYDSYEHKNPPYLCQDNIDSLVWAGGPNRKLIQYNKKTKALREFSLSYVIRIIPKADRVYFVALKGFYYWDRKKDVLEQVPNIPLNRIQTSVMPDESTVILDDKYTYDFNSGKGREGIYLGKYYHDGKLFSFKAENGVYLFHDKDYYPISAAWGFKELIVDECHIFLLFKDKLVIDEKNHFIHSIPIFDANKYEKELAAYYALIDSLQIQRDTNEVSVMEKFKLIRSKYQHSTHTEIVELLSQLETSGFYNVSYTFPKGYTTCYKNESLPVGHRKSCLYDLIDQYAYESRFEKVIALDKDFEKYFGSQTGSDISYYKSAIDSTKKYLHTLDSLNRSGLSEDSIQYHKVMALLTVRKTRWFCSEGCGGCNLSPVFNGLKKFVKKYPQSQLADNAAYNIIEMSTWYIMDDEDFQVANKEYRDFIIKYSDSDLMADAKYNFFTSLHSFSPQNVPEIINAGRDFVKNYPTDPRAEDVKISLKITAHKK